VDVVVDLMLYTGAHRATFEAVIPHRTNCAEWQTCLGHHSKLLRKFFSDE
jgi:hypothetical protein